MARVAIVLSAVGMAAGASACGDDDEQAATQPLPITQQVPIAGESPFEFEIAKLEKALDQALSVMSATPVVGAPQIQSHGVLEVRSVACPDVEPRHGASFTCDVKAINRSGLGKDFPVNGPVHVKQRDEAGEEFSYRAPLRGQGQTTTLSGTIDLTPQPIAPTPAPAPPPTQP
jgi:hypothetical protein